MKKLTLSAAATALAIAAVCAVMLIPAQDAEAYRYIDPVDAIYLCYGAGLTVDTDGNGTWDLGWNEHAGGNPTTCNSVLNSMINQAQINGWAYTDPTCYTFTSDRPCRISVRY
ncbi:MAG: hypothetical protein AAGE94_15670 [Acidobacteriota bacterium]